MCHSVVRTLKVLVVESTFILQESPKKQGTQSVPKLTVYFSRRAVMECMEESPTLEPGLRVKCHHLSSVRVELMLELKIKIKNVHMLKLKCRIIMNLYN